jgi:hypothetical protein
MYRPFQKADHAESKPALIHSDAESLSDLLEAVGGILDRMADGSGVLVDLVVVTTRESLVAEEVDGLVVDAGDVLLVLNMLQAVGLVPAIWKDVEGDLTAYRVAGEKSVAVQVLNMEVSRTSFQDLGTPS